MSNFGSHSYGFPLCFKLLICEKSDIMICQGEPHWLKDLVPIPLAVRNGVALESGGRAGRAKALRMPVGSRCSWMLPGPLEQYGGFVAAPLPGDLQHRASVEPRRHRRN